MKDYEFPLLKAEVIESGNQLTFSVDQRQAIIYSKALHSIIQTLFCL